MNERREAKSVEAFQRLAEGEKEIKKSDLLKRFRANKFKYRNYQNMSDTK